ncbi:Gfo/Idh/MocA family oxidoreductase [Fibrella sp. HMF5335]|uniref:Gfo/Idh/MocA family oxidoreductase n=1 Tax=Fibrella rubiginis TaxID=2817060 RepID=A0A939K4L3_9BACT|nr:Gfo/Idh/MocA family oxidoreductase [Fibrella rubiginis]MBO0938544.1 Gfo/Idh/MocA family oxidoreductase [Fibrella rubiginis]
MKNLLRRQFLQQVGLGIGAMALPALPTLAGLPPSRKLNVALCGLGRYAGYLAEGLAVSQYCRLAGVVSGTPAKLADWQKRYNIPPQNCYNYQNFDEIVANKAIDLVYVVLPNALHKEFTIRAAKAGKHVIVEKPMATTAADCRAMIAACKAAGVQLAVGYRLHYEPHHQELMRLGQQKIFGPVRHIDVSLGYRLDGADPNDWHFKKALSGGGPLMNLGVYCVQSCRYVLGAEPVAVTAQFGPVQHKDLYTEVEEAITWQLYFPGGVFCTSTSANNFGIDRFFASTDNGFFELSPAVSYGPFRGRTSQGELKFPDINQQAAQLDGIGRVLLAGEKLPDHIAGIEGLKDLMVLEAIYKAAETGRRVSINS